MNENLLKKPGLPYAESMPTTSYDVGPRLGTHGVARTIREFPLRMEGSLESVDEARQREIANHALMGDIPPAERAEAASEVYDLYKASKEYVAPVITGFAASLLRQAGGRQIVYAGSDGIGAFLAAKILKEKFDYGNNDPDQNVFAFLTRKIVWYSSPDLLERYLKQCGVRDTQASILMADIGVYGSMIPQLRQTLPSVEPHFVISKSDEIPGYIEMKSTENIAKNPAMHFLEDTFSGLNASPKGLEEHDGQVRPVGLEASFPPRGAMKRLFALKAIEDYARSLDAHPQQSPQEAAAKLDSFLAAPDVYRRLMVPHIRS